jgi:hypothetical protein
MEEIPLGITSRYETVAGPGGAAGPARVSGYFLSFTTTPFKATPATMPPAWHSYSVGLE